MNDVRAAATASGSKFTHICTLGASSAFSRSPLLLRAFSVALSLFPANMCPFGCRLEIIAHTVAPLIGTFCWLHFPRSAHLLNFDFIVFSCFSFFFSFCLGFRSFRLRFSSSFSPYASPFRVRARISLIAKTSVKYNLIGSHSRECEAV